MAGSGPMAGLMAIGSGWEGAASAEAACLSWLSATGRGVCVVMALALHVEDDGGGGLGAADQHLALGGRLERGRAVAHLAGEQRRHAGVADTGPAAPAGGDVAGVGEV